MRIRYTITRRVLVPGKKRGTMDSIWDRLDSFFPENEADALDALVSAMNAFVHRRELLGADNVRLNRIVEEVIEGPEE